MFATELRNTVRAHAATLADICVAASTGQESTLVGLDRAETLFLGIALVHAALDPDAPAHVDLHLITLTSIETGDQFNLGETAERFRLAAAYMSHADEVMAIVGEAGCDGDCPSCDVIH